MLQDMLGLDVRLIGMGADTYDNRHIAFDNRHMSLNGAKLHCLVERASGFFRQWLHEGRRMVFDQFRTWFVNEGVDVFLCMLPAANCQFFMPFNRTLIIWQFQQIE